MRTTPQKRHFDQNLNTGINVKVKSKSALFSPRTPTRTPPIGSENSRHTADDKLQDELRQRLKIESPKGGSERRRQRMKEVNAVHGHKLQSSLNEQQMNDIRSKLELETPVIDDKHRSKSTQGMVQRRAPSKKKRHSAIGHMWKVAKKKARQGKGPYVASIEEIGDEEKDA